MARQTRQGPPARGFRRRCKHLLFRLLALLAALLVLFVVLEIGLRLFTDEGITLLVKDEVVGQLYRKGFEGRVHIPEAERKVSLRFNREGHRGPDHPREKPPGVRRVAVLGDSTVAAVAVDEEDTMVAQLGKLLNAAGPYRWEALSFGVSGYGTAQSLLTWRHSARSYQPDLVILAFTISNDLADNSRELSSGHRPYFDLDATGDLTLYPMSTSRTSLSRLLAKSRLYVWQKDLFRRTRRRLEKATRILPLGPGILNSRVSPPSARAWRITEALLRTLRDEVRADAEADFLVATVPYAAQYDEKMWEELVGSHSPEDSKTLDAGFPDRKLAEIFTRHDIDWVPLLPAFREQRRIELLNCADGTGHWNAAGNLLAAKTIYEHLRRNGLAEK